MCTHTHLYVNHRTLGNVSDAFFSRSFNATLNSFCRVFVVVASASLRWSRHSSDGGDKTRHWQFFDIATMLYIAKARLPRGSLTSQSAMRYLNITSAQMSWRKKEEKKLVSVQPSTFKLSSVSSGSWGKENSYFSSSLFHPS